MFESLHSDADPEFDQGLKVDNIAEQSRASEVSYLWLGWPLEAFEFLMLKYPFSHILETLFLSFLTSTSR